MVDGNEELNFFDKVSLQSLRVGLIDFFSQKKSFGTLVCSQK